MKLYATTTSERASKGQGGNEYLRVNFLCGSSKEPADIGMVELLPTGEDKFTLYYRYMGKSKELQTISLRGTIFSTKKGKKQKGEIVLKKCWCGSRQVHTHE